MSALRTALADYAQQRGTASHVAVIRAVAIKPGTVREIANTTQK
jgi:hypothetical protein